MPVEDLENRVAVLEQEVRTLRELLLPSCGEAPEGTAARHLREAKLAQPAGEALWRAAMEQMGIRGQLIPVEELRARITAGGVRPEDNEFSREIIAMREASHPSSERPEE